MQTIRVECTALQFCLWLLRLQSVLPLLNGRLEHSHLLVVVTERSERGVLNREHCSRPD